MSAPEYITFLAHMRGDFGDSRLLAGTKSRLYVNTGHDANWRLLYAGAGEVTSSGGVERTRWKFAQMGAVAIFTNGVNHPLSWSYEQDNDPVTGYGASPIDDLIAMDVTSARTVSSWRGVVFLGNVVMEGNSYKNRVIWSDFNDPLSFTPLPNSLAAYADLGEDETILAMAPIGGQFRVYTDKAIYDVNLVGGAEVFNFREIYRGPQVLRFENSLVNLGDTHIYAGEDTLWALGELDRTPRYLDWLYKASGAIYKGVDASYLSGIPEATFGAFGPVNRSACDLLVGGYDEAHRMLWFSWASEQDLVPSHSLVMQMDVGKACIVDSGFTAFCSHLPAYNDSVRRWLADMGICPPDPLIGEGNPFPRTYHQSTIACIRNPTEDPKLPPSIDSLCYVMNGNPSLEPNCNPCGNGYKFIMASAQDKCLKEYNQDFMAREYCTTEESSRSGLLWTSGAHPNHPTTTVTYAESGFVSILQTDAMDMSSQRNKTVTKVAVEFDAATVSPDMAAQLFCDVGYGAQPHALMWQGSTPRPINRLSDETAAQMLANNIRPNRIATFPFKRTGCQLGFRLMIAGPSKTPVIGGQSSLNEMFFEIAASHRDYV